MPVRSDVTQEEIDAAIVACLRIFAARGRQLRLERERKKAAETQTEKENADRKIGSSRRDTAAKALAPIDPSSEDPTPANVDTPPVGPTQE